MDALPPNTDMVEISNSWETMVSALQESIKNGVLINIPRFWDEEGKFLFWNFEIPESRIKCFLSDYNMNMSPWHFMSSLLSDNSSDIRDDFLRFLREWWNKYNPCTPMW